MSDSNKPTGVIVVLVVILLATIALFGAEAWNRNHRGETKVTPASVVTPTPAAATPPATPAPPAKTTKNPKASPSDSHDGVLING